MRGRAVESLQPAACLQSVARLEGLRANVYLFVSGKFLAWGV
jgi:hypothetical protein